MAAFSILEQVESHKGPLKVPDLIRIFGFGRQTIYDMIADGRLPAVTIDGTRSRLVDPKSLAYKLRRQNPIMRDAARS